jgi:hypothetical protein
VTDGGHVQAGTLYASISDLHGDGTIAATNGVLDADLKFNAANPTQAVVGFGSGGTLTVTAGVGLFGVGYKGSGSLSISEGVTISTSTGQLGDRRRVQMDNQRSNVDRPFRQRGAPRGGWRAG